MLCLYPLSQLSQSKTSSSFSRPFRKPFKNRCVHNMRVSKEHKQLTLATHARNQSMFLIILLVLLCGNSKRCTLIFTDQKPNVSTVMMLTLLRCLVCCLQYYHRDTGGGVCGKWWQQLRKIASQRIHEYINTITTTVTYDMIWLKCVNWIISNAM